MARGGLKPKVTGHGQFSSIGDDFTFKILVVVVVVSSLYCKCFMFKLVAALLLAQHALSGKWHTLRQQ